MRATLVVGTLVFVISSLGVLPAAATPVDAWLFTATPSFLGPLGLFPYVAPTVAIGTVGIDVATTVCAPGPFGLPIDCVGAGSCNANPSGGPNIGEGCLGNVPFFNSAGAPAVFVECTLIPPAGFLNAFPLFFVAQDVDSNGVINPLLGDIVISNPFFGPTVTAGVFPVGPGPTLLPGIPLHIILWDPAGILGVWPDIAVVTCGAV
jgi:hypothetical protein